MTTHGQRVLRGLPIQGLRTFTARFGHGYWTFFSAAFCMDLGFGLFIFLFNLYLTDLHFDERVIGRIMACFTLGNVAGTIPGMLMTRRYGLRAMLLFTFCLAPILSVLRIFFLEPHAQLTLAFLTGAMLCGWPICFSPVIAQVTRDDNRAAGFSLAFAAGIGLGSLSGIAGGYVPELLHFSALHLSLINGIRFVLVLACATVAFGILPLTRLALRHHLSEQYKSTRIIHPFLLRFLPAFVIWNIVTGSFPVFGAIYLQKVLGIPLGGLGAVFAGSQLAQFTAVLCAPVLLKRFGNANGIAMAQLSTAFFLVLIATTRFMPAAVCFYLLYFATQFMCGPGIYQMLMERVPEGERSTASALQNLSGALCQAGTAAITGACIVAYSYRVVLIGDACVAIAAALLFVLLGTHIRNADDDCRSCDLPSPTLLVLPKSADLAAQKAVK
ncbi:MAG TPA: MFS transporter [Terracidiphilus sp.]|nr:MFS transporter [Terracidiphilus sp.]